jgi:serine/threonine-protein kinase
MARVGAVLPPARELGPLAPVLAQAAISEPLARLDAAVFASELELLSQELDPPEPLPLSRTDLALPGLPRGLDRDPTERFGSAGSSQVIPTLVAPATAPPSQAVPPPILPPPQVGPTTAPPSQIAPPRISPPPALSGVRRIVPAPDGPLAELPRNRRRHRWLPWLLAVLLLELVAGAGVVVASRVVWNHDTVPRVVGLQVTAANAALRRAGLTPEVSGEQYSERVGPGGVMSQLPRSGAREKAGSIVKMGISKGRHPTVLPRLAGMTGAMASSALRHAHLVPDFSKQYNETVDLGVVVSWDSLAGAKVFYGDTVDVVISKGPAPETIPADLSGGVLTWTQAESALTDLHLNPVEDLEYSISVSAGYVVTSRPSPGHTVPGHSTVTVFVSEGPPFVKVPQLYADSVAVAEQALSSVGLQWSLYGPPSAGFVVAQIPGAGTSVRVGTTVTLYLF